MVLHTLSVAPRNRAFDDCLASAGAGDTILLLGDGAYAALPGGAALERLLQHPAHICILAGDARALGITTVSAEIAAIDIAGFVALTEACPRQLAWF